MNSPDDLSGLERLVTRGELDPREIVAVIGKTEGNGCVNDFTRGFSTAAFSAYLSNALNIDLSEVKGRVAFVMSGGTEGVLSPHATVFTRSPAASPQGQAPGLAIGVAATREFLPEEIGTTTEVAEVARAVKAAMADARIDREQDVHFVQVKCPLLTSERIIEAAGRGKHVVVDDTYKSMGYSRGASALGVAVALGEVLSDLVTADRIAHDWALYSNVASASAGIELMNCEIILLGNSRESMSDFVVGHDIMKDAVDLGAVLGALRSAGLEFAQLPDTDQLKHVLNVFAKAEASPSGYVRGRRTTMLTDSDINHTRHARAVVGGIIAAVVGDPMVYVSGGAEHQGPAGGGPVAAIVRHG